MIRNRARRRLQGGREARAGRTCGAGRRPRADRAAGDSRRADAALLADLRPRCAGVGAWRKGGVHDGGRVAAIGAVRAYQWTDPPGDRGQTAGSSRAAATTRSRRSAVTARCAAAGWPRGASCAATLACGRLRPGSRLRLPDGRRCDGPEASFIAIAISVAILLGLQVLIAPHLPQPAQAAASRSPTSQRRRPRSASRRARRPPGPPRPDADMRRPARPRRRVPRLQIAAHPARHAARSACWARGSTIWCSPTIARRSTPDRPTSRLLEPRSEDHPYYRAVSAGARTAGS